MKIYVGRNFAGTRSMCTKQTHANTEPDAGHNARWHFVDHPVRAFDNNAEFGDLEELEELCDVYYNDESSPLFRRTPHGCLFGRSCVCT